MTLARLVITAVTVEGRSKPGPGGRGAGVPAACAGTIRCRGPR